LLPCPGRKSAMNTRFSPFVIKALVDVITGGSGNDPTPPVGIYRTGPQIEQFFLDCGLDMRIGAASRVPATTDFLRRVPTNPDGDAAFERVILRVADPRDYQERPEKGQAVIERLNAALEAEGHAVMIVSGKPQLVSRQAGGAIAPSASRGALHRANFSSGGREWP
jgi:hypothetical protein